MTPMELEPEVLAADYTGEPGRRTFFLQARGGGRTFTYVLEKQQLAVLGDKLREVLILVDATDPVSTSAAVRDPSLRLEAPIEPEWRVGTMGLSYDEVDDRVIVALAPIDETDPEDAEAAEAAEEAAAMLDPDRFVIRFRVSRDQVRSLILHVASVVGEGRPLCQLCGLPIDPEGHICPASNGHRVEV